MNAARQISRRFGRAAGARTRSAASDCIVRTVSFGPDPLKLRRLTVSLGLYRLGLTLLDPDALPKKNSTRVIVYQLGKSASSVGANYREANRGESGDDFRHKISIALKEANESLYWLEILVDLYPTHETPLKLRNEAEELLKLLQSISRSSRARAKSNNRTI